MCLKSASSQHTNHTILTSAEASTSVKTGSSKVVNRTAATLSSSGLTSVRTLQSASAANYQPTKSSRVEVSNNRNINRNEEGTLDGLTNGYMDQPYANESSNHTDHREDSLSETYSLRRERNNLLNRLEQVHIKCLRLWIIMTSTTLTILQHNESSCAIYFITLSRFHYAA